MGEITTLDDNTDLKYISSLTLGIFLLFIVDTNLVYTTKPKVDEDKSKIKKSKIMGDIRQIKSKIDFFILNLVGLKDVITTKKQISKRAEIRGRVCKTFPKKDICDFINKITPSDIKCEGLSKITTKRNNTLTESLYVKVSQK